MTYYLQQHYGRNGIWRCKFDSIESLEDSILIFNLNLTDGAKHIISEGEKRENFEIPDLLLCEHSTFIRNIIDTKSEFILGSNALIEAILAFKTMPHKRFEIKLNHPSRETLNGYSLLLFKDKLNDITVFEHTGIKISMLTNPDKGEVIKGYCTDLHDFNIKQNHLTTNEGMMIQFVEYAIRGDYNVYPSGKNQVVVDEEFAESFDSEKFKGARLLKSSFNILKI